METFITISVLTGAFALRLWANYTYTQSIPKHPELKAFIQRASIDSA